MLFILSFPNEHQILGHKNISSRVCSSMVSNTPIVFSMRYADKMVFRIVKSWHEYAAFISVKPYGGSISQNNPTSKKIESNHNDIQKLKRCFL